MSITTTTHLNFRAQAREALEFYRSVFGGDVMVLTHSQIYPSYPPEEADLVAFGRVDSAQGFHIMAFDVPAARAFDPGVTPLFVSIHGDDADEITRYWEALSAGGQVVQPLRPSGWAPLYGMLTDRFGVTWVLDVAA